MEDKIPLIMWKMNLLDRAIKTWGVDAQLDMVIEEASELITSIQHMKRGRVTWDEVAEEMADVKIMINQFHTIDNVSDAIHIHELVKLKRLEERLIEADKK
jgi:NTP pyrophosphatase (non-canonical NTP hydrolase)